MHMTMSRQILCYLSKSWALVKSNQSIYWITSTANTAWVLNWAKCPICEGVSAWSLIFICRNNKIYYFTQRFLMTRGCVMIFFFYKGETWFWPKVICASSRSLEGKLYDFCLVFIFNMEKGKFLLHKKIAYERVCHDLGPRSFVQVEGHSKKLHSSCLGHIFCNG